MPWGATEGSWAEGPPGALATPLADGRLLLALHAPALLDGAVQLPVQIAGVPLLDGASGLGEAFGRLGVLFAGQCTRGDADARLARVRHFPGHPHALVRLVADQNEDHFGLADFPLDGGAN